MEFVTKYPIMTMSRNMTAIIKNTTPDTLFMIGASWE
jgi:hypothetical protein